MDIQSITPSQVVKAYVGKIGCMCGCLGKYYGHALGAEIDRVSPKMVTKILRTVQTEEDKVDVGEAIDGGHYVVLDLRGKTYAVYTST